MFISISMLKKALRQGATPLTRHRIDLISRLVCALFQVRSVNLKKLACSLSGCAQIDSHYRRLQRFFSSGLSPGVFTELIVAKLVRPGQHWVQRMLILCDGERIELADVLAAEEAMGSASSASAAVAQEAAGEAEKRQPAEGESEKQRIAEALRITNWVVSGNRGAARLLGMSAQTLRYRMRKYGIQPPKEGFGPEDWERLSRLGRDR